MGRNKELTVEQRGTIVYCHQRGDSYRKIAKTVGCGLSTVFDTLKRYDETGSSNSKSRAGRPPLLNTTQRERLEQLVINENFQHRRLCTDGIRKLWKAKTGQEVSARTIGRSLRSSGLSNCVARAKPLVSQKNMEARLTWCMERRHWTKDDWEKVLWSDESTFSQFQQSRNSRVWRKPGE